MIELLMITVVMGTIHAGYILFALFYTKETKYQSSNMKYKIEHIVCFHNESKFIKKKIENCYSLNYPEIHHTFIDDNSTDDTLNLLNKYINNNTTIIQNKSNIGKNQSQIKAVNLSASDLLLFTDANVFLETNSLESLVNSFVDNVGGVTGNVTIKNNADKIEFSGKYWNFEKKIKEFQSFYGSVIGFDGGFYCVKRENYNLKRENELSDFETAFLVFEQTKKTIYVPGAVAVELEERTVKSSFKARMRASNRVFWSYFRIFKYIRRLNNTVVLHFLLHKVVRYLFVILFVLSMPYMLFYSFSEFPWLLIILFIPMVLRILLESVALFVGGIIALTGKEYITWSDKKI